MALNFSNVWGTFKTQIENIFFQKSGGILTGDVSMTTGNTLTVGKDPVNNLDVVTKQYCDTNAIYVTLGSREVPANSTDIFFGTIPNFDSTKYIIFFRNSEGMKFYTDFGNYIMAYGTTSNYYRYRVKITATGDIFFENGYGSKVGTPTLEFIVLPASKLSFEE